MENKKNIRYRMSLENGGKQPPQAIDCEEAVLGTCILHGKEAFEIAYRILKRPNRFYKDIHQRIFNSIIQLYRSNESIDMITVTNKLKSSGELETIGGPYYISQLTNRIASHAHIHDWCYIVLQKYLSRELIRVCSEASRKAYDDNSDILDLIDEHERNIIDINNITKGEGKSKALKFLSKDIYKIIDDTEIEGLQTYYPIGSKKFDHIIGLGPNKIILAAGPAKSGKSKIISFIVKKLFKLYGNHVAVDWVTLEDSAMDVIIGMISSEVLLKTKEIKNKKFKKTSEQMELIKTYYNQFIEYDIEFTESDVKIRDVANHFKAFCDKRRDKFNILIIDNILTLNDRYDFKNDLTGLTDYVMADILQLKQQTKGLIIPIHHLKDSQQYREFIKTGYRPVLSDMKGSEGLRRVPNQVLLFNNPGKYDDLVDEYRQHKDIMKHLFIVDTGANREDVSDDDNALIRFFMTLDYNIFEEIE